MNQFLHTYASIIPELSLALGALALVLVGALAGNRASRFIHYAALVLILGIVVLIANAPVAKAFLFNKAVVVDHFALFVKFLLCGGVGVALMLARGWQKQEKDNSFEFPLIALFSLLGMMIMASANDLMTLYMGLELQSLSLYVLASYDRDNVRSTEAGLKYFVLGALSSGLLLYGASLIYGATGATGFAEIAQALNGTPSMLATFGIVFLLAGIAFKISAVPFHMWTPDVYQGAPTPVTAFLAAAPKVAAMAVLARVISGPLGHVSGSWQQVLIFLAIASMALGAVAAIYQKNIKRVLAFSSIGHMGFAAVGLASANAEGLQGALLYVALYLVMTLGTFACVMVMRTEKGQLESIDDLAGLSRTQPLLAFCLAMLMLSLAGIPPLAGFFAKFYVLNAAVLSGLYPLAIIGVLASVVGCFYYLRIIKIMYFDAPVHDFVTPRFEVKAVIYTATAIVLLFFVAPQYLVMSTRIAVESLF